MVKAALCALVLSIFLSRAVAAETITVAVGEWPPYTSQDNPDARLAQRVATAAFALEGIQVAYRYYPWKRCYVEVKEGRVVATLPWFHSEKRDQTFLFSREPLTHDKEVFFYLKRRNFHWNNFADLKGYRVGATLGYYDTELLEQNGIPLDKVADEKLNFEKMAIGRIDVYATGLAVGNYLIHKLYSPATAALFTHDPKPLHEDNTFVMFSRRAPNAASLRDRFDRGLRALKASGRYAEILRVQREAAAVAGVRQSRDKTID